MLYINDKLKRVIALTKDANLGVQPIAHFNLNQRFLDILTAQPCNGCGTLCDKNPTCCGNDVIVTAFNKNSVAFFHAMQKLRHLPVTRLEDLMKNYRYHVTFFYEDNVSKTLMLVLDNCVKIVASDQYLPTLLESLSTDMDIFVRITTDGKKEKKITIEQQCAYKYVPDRILRHNDIAMIYALKSIPFIDVERLSSDTLYKIIAFNFLTNSEQPVIGPLPTEEESFVIILFEYSDEGHSYHRRLVMCDPNVYCTLRTAVAAGRQIFISGSEIANTLRTAIKCPIN